MSVSRASMIEWCNTLLAGRSAAPNLELVDYLAAIPRLESLSDVPAGTAVAVRGDVDAKPGATIGEGDIRLQSMVETLKFGIERGWKQVIFGHIGRKPEGSLEKVAARLGELLRQEVPLVSDWIDEKSDSITDSARDKIAAAKPGSVTVLENTRRYEIERILWKASAADVDSNADRLTHFSNEFAEKIASVYVHEALSAGSLDTSSTVLPAAMDRVAMGLYEAAEFEGPMRKCLGTQLVIFSGLKIDKLDDLDAMIGRGSIECVFAAGSLAMALKKAIGELDGNPCCLGVAEDPTHADKPYFIPAERIAQAKRMVSEGRAKGIKFVVPVDSVIEDGSVVDELQPGQQQFDIGPKTSKLFEEKIGDFIASHPDGGVAFHNGVFGMFEDPRFEAGTKNFIPQLQRMTQAGIAVYVGGGEGGKALELYGQPDWVTHVFTAGGTVLNALGSEPVPYLVALRLAAIR
ncbi:phosphoglycerate kinase [Bythopirellula polymerisocia]|uniref:Phosphoglycerate kinase n=1 Tax=Bythopirellula polymerisocia TaxID=2528003 RepID=A0A5C6CVJ5_9BACT|nr:phosphoglycerate kinase [Bythopirellula polymerisocia]TWU28572.1 Bifunctional PGK/TIM [Bythopirellula polymerisocia]